MPTQTYQVTLEFPGLRDGSHYYADEKVRAGSEESAKRIAEKRRGGHAVFVSLVRR